MISMSKGTGRDAIAQPSCDEEIHRNPRGIHVQPKTSKHGVNGCTGTTEHDGPGSKRPGSMGATGCWKVPFPERRRRGGSLRAVVANGGRLQGEAVHETSANRQL